MTLVMMQMIFLINIGSFKLIKKIVVFFFSVGFETMKCVCVGALHSSSL